MEDSGENIVEKCETKGGGTHVEKTKWKETSAETNVNRQIQKKTNIKQINVTGKRNLDINEFRDMNRTINRKTKKLMIPPPARQTKLLSPKAPLYMWHFLIGFLIRNPTKRVGRYRFCTSLAREPKTRPKQAE